MQYHSKLSHGACLTLRPVSRHSVEPGTSPPGDREEDNGKWVPISSSC